MGREEVRLDKYLANAGLASRRKVKEIIEMREITVDGEMVTKPGMRIDPSKRRVCFKGEPVSANIKRVYLKLNKPRGYITTMDDPHDRPTVMDLLPEALPRVFPVGRLDMDSSGLLLFTNDGQWAQDVVHPSSEVLRVYEIEVRGKPDDQVFDDLKVGIELADGPAAFEEIKILDSQSGNPRPLTKLRVSISEGRNREIRRMMSTVGHPVASLKRIAIGDILLGNLPEGKWSYLGESEIKSFS